MDNMEKVLQRACDERRIVWDKAFTALSDVIDDVAKDLHNPLGEAVDLTTDQGVTDYMSDEKIYATINQLRSIRESLGKVYQAATFPEEKALIRYQAYQEVKKES